MMTQNQVFLITRNWTTLQDTWQGDNRWDAEDAAEAYVYPPAKGFINKDKWRDLPESYAEEARAYIYMVCTRYPLQLRAVLGLPMWLRFCDVWADTGKLHLAMRAI